MEYCTNGDLKKFIRSVPNYLNEKTVLDFFVQICEGLKYIHSKKIIHRNINLENIYLKSDLCLKIGDFSISKRLSKNIKVTQSIVGSPSSFCPEMVNRQVYDQKSDIWALCCVLYTMCTKVAPFVAESRGHLRKLISSGKVPSSYFRFD